MLPLLAIPVIHSSGAWIASTAASGYVGSTLSATWIGAFIAGNAGILSTLGITSAAGVYAAIGGTLTTAGAAVGTGLTAVGLGGLAQSLGLAPATFLGLTIVGWAVAGMAVLGSLLLLLFSRMKLNEINEARNQGGLSAITWRGILQAAREFEGDAMLDILSKLSDETPRVNLHKESKTIQIDRVTYNVSDVRYIIEKNGKEKLKVSTKIPLISKTIFIIKDPTT
jgi:hypothetical protein